jgi:hypothetical protein
MYHTWVLTKGVLMNKIPSNGLLIATSTFQYPHGWIDGWSVCGQETFFKRFVCLG